MRRTNLVLDAQLLEEAARVLNAKTYSAAVNAALAEIVRMRKVEGIARYFNTQIWEGDLSEMREDRPRVRRQPRRKSK